MVSRDGSNRTHYESYRQTVERGLASPPTAKVVVDEAVRLQFLLAEWSERYKRRYVAVEGNATFPPQLADRPAAAILIARHRLEDSQYPNVPDWPGDPMFLNNYLYKSPGGRQDWNGEPPFLETIHGYGPSLRQLWAKGKQAGAGEQGAWQAIREWISGRPPSWDRDDLRKAEKKALYDPELAKRLESAQAFASTGDLTFPWFAEVNGSTCRVRVNDFPDEYMYSLLEGEELIGDFHDWPMDWTRSEGPGFVDRRGLRRRAPKFAAATDVVAERLLERYRSGDCQAVWSDLMRLGPAVRQKPYLEPAVAVCEEMIRRSRTNLLTLIQRLYQLDYQFWSRRKRKLIRLSADCVEEPWFEDGIWDFPEDDIAGSLATREKSGIVLPLVVRLWAEQIGGVSFLGSHPKLSPFYTFETRRGEIFADPLMIGVDVFSMVDALDEIADPDGDPIAISYDDEYKAEISMDEGTDFCYALRHPNQAIDSKVEGLWYEATFVGYVRKNFQWGGFPGWERYSNRPEKELAFLREGLLEI
jgi:hypothetical protein